MSGHYNPEPRPPPLRPVLTSTITQSPVQELDGSQSWPRWSGGAADGRSSVKQEQKALSTNRVWSDGAENRTGSGSAVSESKTNLGSFARNAQLDIGNHEASGLLDSPQEQVKIPPFPPRPRIWQAPSSETRVEDDVRKPPPPSDLMKPYTLESPNDAPRLSSTAYAGFSSWSRAGRHAEDVLNEQTITSGHYDRVQIIPNEIISARPLIWSSVKHKSGLQVLSSLFTSALKRRQLCGTVSSKCTFKPPPRVTLTDTKREAWLKDLADPAVPLRRLSRTIPHGIRGKALLDQCLSKNVPTGRAVWLVKCVGANEIRAFKRKGASGAFVVGGESKWIKDWTIQVEQFVDSLIQACGASDWRHRITYSLELVSHIYHEHLLQRDFFLDWMCDAIQNAIVDTLPIWLLLAKMYFKDLVVHRRTGRRLASALCAQYKSVCEQGPVECLTQLRNELTSIVSDLLRSCPSCFVLPDTWRELCESLKACASANQDSTKRSYEQVLERNSRFLSRVTEQKLSTCLRILPHLVEYLDSLPSGYDFLHVSKECHSLSNHTEAGVFTILNWATTRYRFGLPRLYLAARLLRHWSRTDPDLDRPIYELLEAASAGPKFSQDHVFKLIAELIRSRHFSVSKYLQWLMARGTETNAASGTPNFFLKLLDHVPTHDQPDHVFNLRRILFGPIKSRKLSLAHTQSILGAQLSFVPGSPTESSSSLGLIGSSLDGFSPCDHYALALWMRQALYKHVSGDDIDDDDDDDEKMDFDDTPALLSTSDFDILFSILDNSNDYAILADILGVFIDFGPKALLTRIASVVNLHFDIFHAIGAADDLFSRLVKCLAGTRSLGTLNKGLVTALIDLAGALPGKTYLQDKLGKELTSIEYSCITAAGSPVADYVPDSSQHSNSGFLLDMDSLLRSGSSMDHPLLSRIFADITTRLQQSWFKDDELLGSFFDILSRLRFFDPEAFDDHLWTWLKHVLPSSSRPSLAGIIPRLVSTGSATLVNLIGRSVQIASLSASASNIAYELLSLLVSDAQSPKNGTRWEGHRFYCQRHQLIKERPDLTSSLLLVALNTELPREREDAWLQPIANSPSFPELFQALLLSPKTDLNSFQKSILESDANRSVLQALERTLVEPLSIVCPCSWQDKIVSTVQAANEFNVAFCQLKLTSAVSTIPRGRINDDGLEELALILLSKVLANEASLGVWQLLMTPIPPEILSKLQAMSLARFFAAMPPSFEPGGDKVLHATSVESLDRCLGATGLVQNLVPQELRFPLLASAAEKLQAILARLSDYKAPVTADHDTEGRSLHLISELLANLHSWVLALLQLLTMHYDIFSHPKLPQATLARLAIPGSLLLIQPSINFDASLSIRVADFLAVLSDHLSSETRQQCLHALREQFNVRDSRIDFLFGSSGLDDGPLLTLVSGDKAASRDCRSMSVPGLEGRVGPGVPYQLRPWEMLSNATPVMGENDTSINLSLFGAKKAVL